MSYNVDHIEDNTRYIIDEMQDLRLRLTSRNGTFSGVPVDSGIILSRFLQSATSYAGSVLDSDDVAKSIISKPESSTGSAGKPSDETIRAFSRPNSLASRTTGPNPVLNNAKPTSLRDTNSLSVSKNIQAKQRKPLGLPSAGKNRVAPIIAPVMDSADHYLAVRNVPRAKVAPRDIPQLQFTPTSANPLEDIETMKISDLRIIYNKEGAVGEAEDMFMRALKGKEKALGSDDDSVVSSLNSLGSLYARQGDIREAEGVLLLAFKGYQRLHGLHQGKTLRTAQDLGRVYRRMNKFSEAELLLHHVLRSRQDTDGSEDMDVLDAVADLGELYGDGGKLSTALSMYGWALDGHMKNVGPADSSTVQVLFEMGGVYAQMKDLSAAEEMYTRALKPQLSTLGPDHPDTLNTMDHLGRIYANLGKSRDAETMWSRVIQGLEKRFGPDGDATLEVVHSLGFLLSHRPGRQAEAEKLLRRVLECREEKLGPDHPRTLDIIYNLGDLYQRSYFNREPSSVIQMENPSQNGIEEPGPSASIEEDNNHGILTQPLDKSAPVPQPKDITTAVVLHDGRFKPGGQSHIVSLESLPSVPGGTVPQPFSNDEIELLSLNPRRDNEMNSDEIRQQILA